MSVNSKMTAIADKVRTLLGISGKIGLDAMEDNLGTAVEACDSQAALIAQIKTALEGKAAGGSGGGCKFEYVQNSHNTIRIGNYAFEFLENIKSVTVKNCDSIGVRAFTECHNLESVDINTENKTGTPDVYIGEWAFDSCSSLTSVSIHKTAEIGRNAFRDCKKLERVDFTGRIGGNIFSVIARIGNSAFLGCENIKISSLRASILDDYCFRGCTSIEKLSIDECIEIGLQAFKDCTSLQQIIIIQEGEKDCKIGANAFWGCSKLTSVVLRDKYNVWTVDFSDFADTPMMTGQGHIYVYASIFESYRSAYETAINSLMPGFFDILFRKIEDYPEIWQ